MKEKISFDIDNKIKYLNLIIKKQVFNVCFG